MKTTPTNTNSLYERLGGKRAIDLAVEGFYERVLADASLRPFFDGVDIAAQRAKQRVFLAYAFGGPVRYDGQSLRTAHAPLVQRGLGDAHFDAVASHLAATLEQLDVDVELIEEVLAIAGSTRADVLAGCDVEQG